MIRCTTFIKHWRFWAEMSWNGFLLPEPYTDHYTHQILFFLEAMQAAAWSQIHLRETCKGRQKVFSEDFKVSQKIKIKNKQTYIPELWRSVAVRIMASSRAPVKRRTKAGAGRVSESFHGTRPDLDPGWWRVRKWLVALHWSNFVVIEILTL